MDEVQLSSSEDNIHVFMGMNSEDQLTNAFSPLVGLRSNEGKPDLIITKQNINACFNT